jgi:hypothetical protein
MAIDGPTARAITRPIITTLYTISWSQEDDKYWIARQSLCFRHRLRFSSSFTVQISSSIQKKISKMKSAIVLLAAAASVSAHSTWQDLWVGTTDQATTCTRTVIDNNPIASLTSADMFCGRSPKATTGVCTVAGMYLIICQN